MIDSDISPKATATATRFMMILPLKSIQAPMPLPLPSRGRPPFMVSPAAFLFRVELTLLLLLPFLTHLTHLTHFTHAAPTTKPPLSLLPAARLTRRAPANPIGWRGEFLVLSLNENSAPSLSGPNDYYKSEGNPEWLVFHSSNRSWTGWVPLDGPSDTQLTFQLVGQVQDRTIRQPMSVTIIKRPQGGRPRSSSPASSNNLSPDFLTAIPLPTSSITPKSPAPLINQLAQVFSPTVKVTDVTLSDPALVPPASDTLAVTKLNATYNQLVFWSAPSRTVRWQQVQSGPGAALPTWLTYDAGSGALSGTVPAAAHRTALPMPVARDLKRGAIQLTVTANTPPTATTTAADAPAPPKPTQVVVIAPAEANRAPRIANPNPNRNAGPDSDRTGWTAAVRSGTSIRWSVPSGWTQDPDLDATMWVAVQSSLGLPKWATWDASQGVLSGRVPRTSTILDTALVTDWANVSLPLRGSMPPLPWSLSTCMWVAAVDPLGAVSNWQRADVVVDEWVPPTPRVPVFDVPATAADGSDSGGVVRLDELFMTNVTSVFEWDGFVGILPSDAPVTLDQGGGLIADPIGGNREIVAHVVVVDRKGGVGLVTVRFAKREGSGEDVTMNGGGGGGEGGGSGGNADSNGQLSVGEILLDKWFAGVDTSSVGTFFRTAPRNTAVQVLAGCVLGLILVLVVVVAVVRRRRRARAAAQRGLGGAIGKGGGSGESGGSGRRGSGNGLMMSLYNAGASANGSRGSLSQVAPAPAISMSKSSSATPLRQQQLQQDANRKSLNRVSFSDTVKASDGTLQRLNAKEGRIGEGLVPRAAEQVGAAPSLATPSSVTPTSAAPQASPSHAQSGSSRSPSAPAPAPAPAALVPPATHNTPPCHPPTYPAPAPYLPPNPSATDLSLANAWLALCPDHYIAQSPTVSVCTTSMYSNRPESGAPGAPGNTLPRLTSGRSSGTSSSSYMEPPPDMPHAVAIVGQPFTYDHPDLAALATQSTQQPAPPQFGRGGRNNLHAQQQPTPMFRFGIRRDQNSPTWITVDATSGRLQGIPFAGDNFLGYVVTIMRWNVAVAAGGFSDPDSSFMSSGSRTVPPPHAQEAAKVWVSVSDAQMPAPRFAVGPSGDIQQATPQQQPQGASNPRIPPVPALVGTAIPVLQTPNLSPHSRVGDHPRELPKTPPPPQPPAPQPQRVIVTQVIPTTGAASTSQPLRPPRTNSTRLTVRRLNRATTATVDTDYEFNMAAGDDDSYSINSHRISEYYPVNVPGGTHQPMSHPIRSSIPNRPPTARGRQRSSSVSLDMPYEENSDTVDPDTTRHLRDLLKHRRSGSFDSVTREQWRASRRYTRSSDMDREDRERFEAWLRGEKGRSTLMMGEFDYSGDANVR